MAGPSATPAQQREPIRWNDTRLLLMVGLSVLGTLLFTSKNGARYRAMAIDGLANWKSRVKGAVQNMSNLASQGHGFYTEATKAMGRSMRRSDAADIMRQIRRQIELHTKSPHSIGAELKNGVVTLRGSVLAHEVKDLVGSIEALPSVRQVIDQLDAKVSHFDLNDRQ